MLANRDAATTSVLNEMDGQQPDPALALISHGGAPEDASGGKPYDDSTCSQLKRFEDEQAIPDFLKPDFAQMDSDRKYVHTDVFMPLVVDAVCTNLVLRNQYVRLTQTYARDPDLSVQPKRLLEPVPAIEQIVDEFSALAVQADYDKAVQHFRMLLQRMGMFGRTIEVLVKHFADECHFRDLMMGSIQDATTVGIAWLKVSWTEKLGQDPIGETRPNDFQDTVNRFTRLVAEYNAKEWDDADGRYKDMMDLSDNIREKVKAEAWKQMAFGDQDPREMREALAEEGKRMPRLDPTELPRYRGFTVDPLMAEDVRFDWSVTRPEEFRRARWMAHPVRMTWEKIHEDFGMTQDEVMSGSRPDRRVMTAGDPRIGTAARNLTTTDPQDRSGPDMKGDGDLRPLVWERWDREQNRVYVWVEGSSVLLADYEPEIVSSFWFPFFPLWFNRVTGKALPVSDTKLMRQLNDEFNMLRTHDREGRRAAYNKYIVAKNLFSADEMRNLRNCPPEGVIECEKADDIHKYIMRVIGSHYNPALYDTAKVRLDLDAMSGISSAARGAPGSANFATEEKSAQEMMAAESDRYREQVEHCMAEIFRHMAEILVEILPESNAKAIAGPGAYWPHLDRKTLWRGLMLDIEAGSTGKPDRARRVAELKEIAEAIGTMLPMAPEYKPKLMEWLRDLMDAIDSRREPEDYLERIPLQGPVTSDVAVAAGTAKEGQIVQQVASQAQGPNGSAPPQRAGPPAPPQQPSANQPPPVAEPAQ